MDKSSSPESQSNQKSEVEIVKEITLLELETKMPDGSTEIARIYQPRTIPQPEPDMRFILNAFIGRLKTIIWNVLVNLKIIKPKD